MTSPFTRSRTRTRAALTAAGVLLAAAPVAPAAYAGLGGPQAPAAPLRGEPYVETRLLFGTERPDGGPAVTPAEFTAFVDKEVTPSFPDGLTVQEGRGQWRDAGGRIEKERSYELILLDPAARARARDRTIEDVRADYRRIFGQEAVARVDDRARVDF
jgi:hypothetical protein